jgi:hypothetical protein
MSRPSSHAIAPVAVSRRRSTECTEVTARIGKDCGDSEELSTSHRSDASRSEHRFIFGACIVCDGLRDDGNGLVREYWHRPETAGAACESLVGSFGFCAHHGIILERQRANWPATVGLLRVATERVLELLSDKERNAERLVELFFDADRSCPWCKLHEQQVARQVNRLPDLAELQRLSRWLCFPHYRKVAFTLKSAALPALVRAQLQLLEHVMTAIGPHDHRANAKATELSIAPATLNGVLRVLVGEGWLGFDQFTRKRPDHRADRAGEFGEGEPGCPVCAEIVRAQQRWHSTVQTAARLGQDLWTVFPTCPVHLALCARVDREPIAILAARYGASVQLAGLVKGSDSLARDHDRRLAAAQSVFYRRQSPAYILGQQRKMITRFPRCPACERAAVAQQRAIVRLVQKLGAARLSASGASAGRLCLKHFASIYLLVSQGEPRALLVARQVERLRELRHHLVEAGKSSDVLTISNTVSAAIGVWRTAMWQPSGCP